MNKKLMTKIVFVSCALIAFSATSFADTPAKTRKPAQVATLACGSRERASDELADRASKDSGSNSCKQTEFAINTPAANEPAVYTAAYQCPVNQRGQALEKTFLYNYTSGVDAHSGECQDKITPAHSFIHPEIATAQ